MSYRPYGNTSDWSGGNMHQIAFNNTGLYWRNGGTSWNVWNFIGPGSYDTYRWGQVNYSSGSTTGSVSITTHGRPVFVLCCGDNNPSSSTNWIRINLYRDTTKLRHQICESHGSSWNIPFCIAYLDTPVAGTYTYKAQIDNGSGSATILGEEGAIQGPQLIVFEI